jgi:hypothetical protein
MIEDHFGKGSLSYLSKFHYVGRKVDRVRDFCNRFKLDSRIFQHISNSYQGGANFFNYIELSHAPNTLDKVKSFLRRSHN